MPIKFTEQWYQNLPILDERLSGQLFQIRPSYRFGYNWFPCSVKLKNGEVIERVYLINAAEEKEGCWLGEKKALYPLEDVVEIKESPYRLPHRIWKKLNKAGETAMGYLAFTLKFFDGSSFPYVSDGYFLDFFEMPEGKKEKDIIDVTPHHPRQTQEKRLRNASFGFIYYRK